MLAIFTLFLPAFLKKEWLFQSRKHSRACNGIWFWLCVFCLDCNQLFAFETDVLILALHNIPSEGRKAGSYFCLHTSWGGPSRWNAPTFSEGEKNPIYEALVWGLAMDQFGSSKKQTTKWTYIYRDWLWKMWRIKERERQEWTRRAFRPPYMSNTCEGKEELETGELGGRRFSRSVAQS